MEPERHVPPAYQLLEVLARGAQASVYRARQLDPDREVVIKVCTPATVAPELRERALQRVAQEARLLQRIRSPHVVQLLACELSPEAVCLVYPDERGYALSDLMRRHPLPDQDLAIQVLRDGLAGLGALHQQGVVHRDVKPANLLYLEPGRFQLIDLGLARDLGGQGMGTATGEFLGTPTHAAPGQLLGEAPVPRDDVYSLGLVAYELATGQYPFPRSDQGSLLRAQLNQVPRRARELEAGVPSWLSGLLSGMVEKRADRRPDAAEALARLEERAVEAPTPSRLGSTLEGLRPCTTVVWQAPPEPAESAPLGAADLGSGGSRWRAPFLGLLAALLLALGSWWGTGAVEPPSSASPTHPPDLARRPGAAQLASARREVEALGQRLGEGVAGAGPLWHLDPLTYPEVLAGLPTLRELRRQLAGPGHEARLAAFGPGLAELDRELDALGVEPPFGPLLQVRAAPGAGAATDADRKLFTACGLPEAMVPETLDPWTLAALQQLASASEEMEKLRMATRSGGPAVPLEGRNLLLSEGVSGHPLFRIAGHMLVRAERRVRLVQWLAPATAPLLRSLLASGRASPRGERLMALVHARLGDDPVGLLWAGAGDLGPAARLLRTRPGTGPLELVLLHQGWRFSRLFQPLDREAAPERVDPEQLLQRLERFLDQEAGGDALSRALGMELLWARVDLGTRLGQLASTAAALELHWPAEDPEAAGLRSEFMERLVMRLASMDEPLELETGKLEQARRSLVQASKRQPGRRVSRAIEWLEERLSGR